MYGSSSKATLEDNVFTTLTDLATSYRSAATTVNVHSGIKMYCIFNHHQQVFIAGIIIGMLALKNNEQNWRKKLSMMKGIAHGNKIHNSANEVKCVMKIVHDKLKKIGSDYKCNSNVW